MGALEQPLHSSFCYCWAAELHRQCRVTEESASCMQHSLLPTGGAVENLSLHRWSVQAWKYLMFIQPHFCLGVSRVSVHIFTYRCVFVISLPLFLHLFLTGKPQADWIGYTPLFLLHHPTPPALFLSLPLVPLCDGTKALLGMAWHLLAHFVSPSFYVLSLLKKSFELDLLFIYKFLLLSGSSERILVWHNSKQ